MSTIQLLAEEQITCDVFANSSNARTQKFYSKVASPNSSGINAFSQSWSDDFNFCCPPVKYINDVIQHLKRQPAKGILIVPLWPFRSFWTRITSGGAHLLDMFHKHVIFQPTFRKGKFCEVNLFDGQVEHFSMLALVFESNIPETSLVKKQNCLSGGCSSCITHS